MGIRELLRRWFTGSRKGRDGPPSCPAAAASSVPEADRWCLEGAQHLESGRLAEAEHAIKRALDIRHDHVEALVIQSAIFAKRDRLEEATDSLVLATHFRPDFAEAHYQLGAIAARQGRTDASEMLFRRAILKDPSHAKAYNFLGTLLADRGAVDEAVDCFRQCVAIRPDFAPAHSNLGSLLITKLDRFEEGATSIETAFRLAPDSPDVQCNWAMLLQYRGQLQEALAWWTDLINAGALANDASARLDRAMILLLLEDFETGWDEYEARFAADRRTERNFGLKPWNGEPLEGKSLLIYAEQGVGDEIMFASCVPDLLSIAGRVVIECSGRLQDLFRRSFPGAAVVGRRSGDSGEWLSDFAPIDYQIPIGSLPRRFRRRRETFDRQHSYLKGDAGRVAHWRGRLEELGPGPAIGISWRGGNPTTRGTIRSLPPELLREQLRADVTWVNLQHGADALDPALGGLHRFSEVTQNLDELAALMGALDLIISVDNTNVHLAGALGRPVWVLLASKPEWRYGVSGESMRWYASSRLYRRAYDEDWGPVLERLMCDLDRFIEESRTRSTPS